MRGNVSQLRELQAFFNENINNLCVAANERVMKGELEDELPDDIREVCRQQNREYFIKQTKICFCCLAVC